MSATMAFFILGCICIFTLLWLKSRSRNHPPYPPGPPADPILGHLRHIPSENQDTLFYEWGKIYGDVIHLHFLGRSIIILNSVQAATDLLDSRSSIYSDRPRFIVYDLIGFGNYTLTFLQYGKQFQRHRQMFHEYLADNKCLAYRPIQTREVRILLQNILADESGRDKFIHRFSAATIMGIAYGHQITSDDDLFVEIAEDAARAMANAGPPGGTAIDFLPFLQYFPSWFPGTHYANYARDNKGAIQRLYNHPFEQVQKEMAEGKAKPSFLSHHLEVFTNEGKNYSNTIEDIKGAAGALYLGAADTTASTMSTFFLAMVLHPECQVRAQKEIDAVVGCERLPDFSDRGSLPYVDCIIQETLRWNHAVPLGVPHRVIQDDVYRGMFIPKGSMVVANTRAMTLDSKIYSNPHDYNPSRFLPKPTGNGEPYPNGPFGFGRRICPAQHFAEASLWIAITSILATFNISKAIGKDGREITPEVNFTCGIMSHPQPYQCRIQPRHEAARRLISDADIWDGY